MNSLHSSISAAMASRNDGGPPPRAARLAAIALVLAGSAFGAFAQYKIVGPDGHVTYTDKPPTASDLRANGGGAAGSTAANTGAGGGSLPYAVRQASARYPVTLYAAKVCAPCDQTRQWLKGHGIPFSEYSVDSSDDVNTLKQRFGDGTMPVTTIGGQTIKGFASNDLQSYADAAGYPKQTSLAGYSYPAPVPLAPVTHAPPPAAAPAPAANSQKIDLPAPSKNGIQF